MQLDGWQFRLQRSAGIADGPGAVGRVVSGVCPQLHKLMPFVKEEREGEREREKEGGKVTY